MDKEYNSRAMDYFYRNGKVIRVINKQLIAETLKELLPESAEVEFNFQSEDFLASFCWLLHNDPKRPFKRSKKVQFIVNKKALVDFAEIGNKQEAKVLINLEAYINHQLTLFNPQHETPEGVVEPVEKWKIDSLLFLESLDNKKGVKRRLF